VGSPLPPSPSDAAHQFTGRAAYALSQLYYYLVAIVAIGFVIGGTIAALIALRQLAWPDPGGVTRQSVEALLQGLALAFLAYVVALGGVVAALFSLIDAAFAADCPGTIGQDLGFVVCRDADDALRSALNGLIVVLVAGTVWWWHLREGRRTVSP
jgi:hypothetical protein